MFVGEWRESFLVKDNWACRLAVLIARPSLVERSENNEHNLVPE